MIVLGLTGSIAMGKSTAARMFRRHGVPVFDADRVVHRLLGRGGGAVAAIDAAFPDVVVGGAVDRARLGRHVFGKADALKTLEGILHPLVASEQRRFLTCHARAGRPLVVLDIPLLLETGGERDCDRVMVVSAPPFVQDQRLRRRGLGPEQADAIKSRQMPDSEKRCRADIVIPTGLGHAVTAKVIRSIIGRYSRPRRRTRDATAHRLTTDRLRANRFAHARSGS
jgi:dephospho-CoA kinase